MSSFAASQMIPGRIRRGLAGQLADTGRNEEYADLEIAGRTAQVITITVASSVNLAAYTLEVPELGISPLAFVGGASDTLTAAALVAAWNADPQAYGFAVASNAAGVVTLTGVGIGDDYHRVTLVPSNASIFSVVYTTDASEPADYPVARAVYVDSNGKATRSIPTAGSFVITPAAVNSAVYRFSFRAGDPASGPIFSINYTADGSASVQEIVEGLKADFDLKVPSSIATAAEDNTKITVTGAGQAITLLAQDANSTPSAQVVGGSILDKLVGFSYYDYQSETAQGATTFAQNGARRVCFVRTGALYVEEGDSAKWRDAVYLGIDSGTAAEFGKVFASSGSGRARLPIDRVCFGQRPNVIELSLGR